MYQTVQGEFRRSLGLYPSVQGAKLTDDWFDRDWKSRILLIIKSGQVPTSQSLFPLLVNDTYPDMIGAVEAEIRFAGNDNRQLEYEIQKFDDSTGELIAWTKKPTVSDGDILGIYWDNPAVSDEQDSAAVFSANYRSVYHGQNNGDDSTSSAQDLVNFGTAQTPVPAKIGNGLDYGGTVSDYSIRDFYSGFALSTTEVTAEYWIKTSGTGDGMISYAIGVGALANHFLTFNQSNLETWISNGKLVPGVSFNDGVFHHIVVTWRSSDGQTIVYIDGVTVFSTTFRTGFSLSGPGTLVLAQDQDVPGGGFDGSMALDGILDEVRLSDISRSTDYVATSFNNQNSQSTFYTTLPLETTP